MLGARFASVLSGLRGREVGVDALFETLKLEALDWGFDQGIEAQVVDTEDRPVPAVDGREEA